MLETAERIRRVQLRAKELHRKRENRFLGGLSIICAVLAFSLIGGICVMTGSGQVCTVTDFYGAMLLYEDAGGYVLAGVLSFAAAVLITVLCIRSREKTKRNNNNTERNEKK